MNKAHSVQSFNEPFPYVVVDDFFSEKELVNIYNELDWYVSNYQHYFDSPRRTGTAVDLRSAQKKSNAGFFIDGVYTHPKYSSIARCSESFFNSSIANIKDNYIIGKNALPANGILLSYYNNGDFYKPHSDQSYLTACLWLYKEPKRYEGGNFIFSDCNLPIECKNNRMVIFPGSVVHEVTEIKMNKDDYYNGYGRFTVSYFLAPPRN